MPIIGPPARRALTAAGLALVVALAGCGEGYNVARRSVAPKGAGAEAAATPAKSCRFELSPAPLPVSRASWLSRIDIAQRFWPKSMYADYNAYLASRRQLGARAPNWPEPRFDRVRFEDFRGPVSTVALRNGEQTIFFLARLTSRRSGSPPGSVGGCNHKISMLIDEGERVEQVVVPGVEAGRADAPLEMVAAVIGGQLVLVYASADSIYAIVGGADADGIALSPPGLLRKTPVPAADLRLAASGGRAILAWSEPPQVGAASPLRVVSSEGGVTGLSGVPHALTETLRPGTATLLVDGDDVHVAWVDLRFDPMKTDAGRIMIAPSHDGGATFGEPTVISDLREAGDVAARIYLGIGDDGLVVFAANPPGVPWPETWSALTVDSTLRTAAPAGQIAGRDLLAAYRTAVEPILLGLPAAAPEPPNPTETASYPDPVSAEDH